MENANRIASILVDTPRSSWEQVLFKETLRCAGLPKLRNGNTVMDSAVIEAERRLACIQQSAERFNKKE